MKIEFGSGQNAKEGLKEGFVGCDIRSFKNVKYVCDCWKIHDHVDENSVEEIYSRHMFEHLTFAQGEAALKSWFTILKNGGKAHLIMPDLKYHAEEYLKYYNNREGDKMPNFTHAIAGFFGWQREDNNSKHFSSFNRLWDVHKSGHDEMSLKNLVQKCGYKNFKRQNNKKGPWHLDVTFYKK
jgi:predicted SAM-dependent methyltransferase